MSHNYFFGQSEILDPDAARYIRDVQAADGAGLEGGIKRAINAFVVGCKRDGIWDSIKSSCILAGARTLTGSLVPLKGTAPTNFNFVSGDYDRKTGLIGDRSTKYLDSNRAGNADPQNSIHQSAWSSTPGAGTIIGYGTGASSDTSMALALAANIPFRNRGLGSGQTRSAAGATGFIGTSRSAAASYISRLNSSNETITLTSLSPASNNHYVFNRSLGTTSYYNGRLAFYSIGESIDLAKLDARVTALFAAYQAALGDSDAVAYIAAVEAADGQSLESGVRDAFYNFIVGCKTDGTWDSIKASCILAGARTLSGVLVPLKGTAPTNNNFVSGDYDRKTGLIGNGTTKYLNSNRNNATDPQNSKHVSAYATTRNTEDAARAYIAGASSSSGGDAQIFSSNAATGKLLTRVNNAATVNSSGNLHASNGLFGGSRDSSSNYIVRGSGTNETLTSTSAAPDSLNIYVFARNLDGVTDLYSNGRLAFYSIGESINLAKLDSRISALITALGVAI